MPFEKSRYAEGIAESPENDTAKQGYRLLQPAVKCRRREYLRIIYGAEYLTPEHRRSVPPALKGFSLGMESLHRFVSGEQPYSGIYRNNTEA